MIPFIIANGIVQAAIVAAQTIPAFETGGIVEETGTVLVGEKRHELWVSPDGKIGITPDKPTFMHMEKGTEIYPDLNKVDLMKILGYKKPNQSEYDMMRLENVITGLRKDLSKQRVPKIKADSLFNQLNRSDKFAQKRRGLLN